MNNANKNTSTGMIGTPLRSSNSANKPFCSPFRTDSTPVKSSNLKRIRCSPVRTATPSTPDENIIKRRRIDIDRQNGNVDHLTSCTTAGQITKNDLLMLKKRVRNLRQEVECVKIKLACKKKHKQEDIKADINIWREACHKALIQYQKNYSEAMSNNKIVTISDILLDFGIPEDVVKFPQDY